MAGRDQVGGLVGRNHRGTITASYATSAISGRGSNIGGLVGWNDQGTITASYAMGAVTDRTQVAGLVGGSNHGTITASYWDTATSGQASSAGGTGQTTGALQAPTGYTGLYAGWNVDLDGDGSADDPWHFGAATDYPVLQVDVNGDGTATWQEFGDQRPAPAADRIDYDTDDDGLIEVANPAQLHAIRWDLDGNGVTTAAGYAAAFPSPLPGMGCRTGCTGYELTADLDVDSDGDGSADADDTYWNHGAGWDPIGGTYTGTFDGNGHTIAHLVIKRSRENEVGLFQRLGSGGVLRNLGLRAVDVTGQHETGGLVGENDRGTITASYVSGRVAGRDQVGGLVGRNHRGTITASYATSAISGRGSNIGGLVGWNDQGTITASYAMGAVTDRTQVAGLVGGSNHGTITASYAAGACAAASASAAS